MRLNGSEEGLERQPKDDEPGLSLVLASVIAEGEKLSLVSIAKGKTKKGELSQRASDEVLRDQCLSGSPPGVPLRCQFHRILGSNSSHLRREIT
jgi:hypothetical protein